MKGFIICVCVVLSLALIGATIIMRNQEKNKVLVSGIVADRFIKDGFWGKHYILKIELNACEVKYYNKEVDYMTYCESPKGTYCSFRAKLKDIRL